MQNGLDFEDLVTDVLYGRATQSEPWYNAAAKIAGEIRGCQIQFKAKKVVQIHGMDILLYGRLDALGHGEITDIKFSKKYERGKYFDSTQHPMYFELISGAELFTYRISNGTEVWHEAYRREEVRSIIPTVDAWVNLITYVDDFGRGDARPAIIKGTCFPLRERLSNADIEAALQALAGAGCVGLYEVDGKAAAVAFVSSDDRGFMPAPGQILDKIKTLAETGALPAGEAWRLVSDAVTRCDRFNPAKEYNKLPPEVQRAVGSPQMLVEWGNVDPQSFQTVIASNFRRAYDTRQKREQELAVLPESVRRVIGELSDRLSLSSRENEKRGIGGCKHD